MVYQINRRILGIFGHHTKAVVNKIKFENDRMKTRYDWRINSGDLIRVMMYGAVTLFGVKEGPQNCRIDGVLGGKQN